LHVFLQVTFNEAFTSSDSVVNAVIYYSDDVAKLFQHSRRR